MAWKDNHPNWLAKALFLGYSQDFINKIRNGGTPGPEKLAAFDRLRTRADGSVYDPTAPTAAPAGSPAAVVAAAAPTPSFDQSAYDRFRSILGQWGIPVGPDIEGVIRNAVIEGLGPDNIELVVPDLQATASFKNRFPGFDARVNNGFNAITLGEYLQLENAYHRIMSSAGLPAGFYDDPSDFGKFIAQNVSPEEIQSRVEAAVTLANQVDPTARGLLTQFYGVGTGDIAAYFLDPGRAMPALDKQYKAVNVASFAAKAGLNLMGSQHYEDLVDQGVSIDQAAQGYGTIKTFADTFGKLGQIYGEKYDVTDAEGDVFFNRNEKRRRLASQEAAAFSARSGFDPGMAKRGSTAGSY